MTDLQRLLDSFGLGDQFEVVQPDTMELRCQECNEIVTADVVDLHACVLGGA